MRGWALQGEQRTEVVGLLEVALAAAAGVALPAGQLVLGAVVPGHQRVPDRPGQACMQAQGFRGRVYTNHRQ